MSGALARVQVPAQGARGQAGVVRRKCACGRTGHECEECKRKVLLQRQATVGGSGHDFSRVRVNAVEPAPEHPVAAAETAAPGGQATPSGSGSTASAQCGPPCEKPWIEAAPNRFMSLCTDDVKVSGPRVHTVGCTPGRPGRVEFLSGNPAWDLAAEYTFCPGPAPHVQVGLVQSVERLLAGGVYFERAAGEWRAVEGQWHCVAGARDCLAGAQQPWYGTGAFGPQQFGGTFPILRDTPKVTLDSRRQGRQLRRMRLDGLFQVWLIASRPGAPPVFVHHWTIELLVVAVLPPDADPCNVKAWRTLGKAEIKTRGTGRGTATPVLTGPCARGQFKPC